MTNDDGITATTYDWRNLPLSVTVPSTTFPFTPLTHTYRYDHQGRRVYSSVDSTYTIRGAYGEPIAEYAGGTPALKHWNYVRPDGVVIGRREGGNRFYYHRDHLGSTRTVLSHHTTPNVVETYDFMPFGEFMDGRILINGTGARSTFTGHTFDDETALYTMHWRRYNARIGQFRTPDPMADSYPGWNVYAYVLNDPVRLVDPTGMCAESMMQYICVRVGGAGEIIVEPGDTYEDVLAFFDGNRGLADPIWDEASRFNLDDSGTIIGREVTVISAQAYLYKMGFNSIDLLLPNVFKNVVVGWQSFGKILFAKKVATIVRNAGRGQGNFSLGSGTFEEAMEAGRAWVGAGYTIASDGKTLLSADKLRAFRPPSFKPRLGKTQASFEWRNVNHGSYQGNGHLDIIEQ